MSKPTRIIDFVVFAWPGLPAEERRSINAALFATYEPVRLWLKERQIKGPFRKLAVTLNDLATSRVPPLVMNALNVCEVIEGVPLSDLRERAADHRWVLGVVKHALSCVAESKGWRSPELEDFVAEMAERPMPQLHYFERLKRVDRRSGTTCVPWFSARPGETRIGVRFVSADDEHRDVTVLSHPDLLFLEDKFPMAKSAIRDSTFVLLDKRGNLLASTPIPEPPVARASRQ